MKSFCKSLDGLSFSHLTIEPPHPPCTDRECGIQLFLQLRSGLAAQIPTISIRDFETSNGEMPWYPGGGADFLNDYATRSTTASGRSAK